MITNLKEIYKKIEIGDIIGIYCDTYKSEERLKIGKVLNIEKCYSDCNHYYGCNIKITIDIKRDRCFLFTTGKCLIKYIIKNNFITEEEFNV